ncbi:hypothetical protein KGM_210144 [Danaus plexippus plexippus]|uniref:Integral membrane protein 2 n=1 Tax=Danaus plexippus plexippus TaxID=278856 RepID=A0A212EH09_DANPL|nr:hypothetical protein KGM_210144 [Danaus plexippus plexippus]
MTMLTKPSAIIRKPEVISAPLVEKTVCDEGKIDIHPTPEARSSRAMLCLSLTAMLLLMLGFTSGLTVYREYMSASTRRYQGFCSIPLPNDIRELQNSQMIESNFRVLPLSWSPEDVQVVSTSDDDQFVNALREELDIGDNVEKISVINNGHRVSFIHDFNDNTTGIIDSDRCFIMDLEPELVLSPSLFIAGLQRGSQFDVSRVRSSLRAALPAITFTRLSDDCAPRPTYRLTADQTGAIRKRSAEDPPHDYMQFSGKHVQEIKIDNLQEVLQYENKDKKA